MTEELRKKRSENQKRLWADPEYRANQLSKRGNKEWRKNMSVTVKTSEAHCKGRKIQSQKVRDFYQDPVNRKKASERNTEVMESPKVRANLRCHSKRLWQDPVYRAKQQLARDSVEWHEEARRRSIEVQNRPIVRARKVLSLRRVMPGKNLGRVVLPETRAKISKALKGSHKSDEVRAKFRAARLGKKHSAFTRQKIAEKNRERVVQGQCWKKGIFTSSRMRVSLPYQSSYELRFLELAEKNQGIVTFTRCNFGIPYFHEGSEHLYIPDFIIIDCEGNKTIVEIKPKHFLKYPANLAKFGAAKQFCQIKGFEFRVDTEDELGIHT